MVTGVETAGLVLAAFPLIVSAIQQYREGLELLKDWWRYRTKFLEFSGNISTQRLIFEENVEILLSPIVTSDVEMAALLKDPGGPEWAKPDLTKRLERRLPKSYDSYMRTIQDLNRILEELKTHLGFVEGKVIMDLTA